LLGPRPHSRDQLHCHDRDSEIDEEGQDVVWSGDVEGVERRDEEEVEGQEPEDRAEQRRPEPTTQRQEEGQEEIQKEDVENAELSASSQREGCVSSPVPSGVSRLVVPFGIVSITLTGAPVLRASLEQTIPWAGFMFATVAV